MLILTRRTNETVFIGDAIKITVLTVKYGQVRIGIDAPKDIPIYRDELLEQIRRKQQIMEEKLIEE